MLEIYNRFFLTLATKKETFFADIFNEENATSLASVLTHMINNYLSSRDLRFNYAKTTKMETVDLKKDAHLLMVETNLGINELVMIRYINVEVYYNILTFFIINLRLKYKYSTFGIKSID